MIKILGIGPYVGNFKEEILTFRPYLYHLKEKIEYEKIYVNSHFNRRFLYNNIENYIPIPQNLSRDELNQQGYVHNILKSQRDFNIIQKFFKEEIVKRESCSKKDIKIYYLNYVKATPPLSIDEKKFIPISYKKKDKNYIIYIPDKIENTDKLKEIYKFLKDTYNSNIKVIGDLNCLLYKENILLTEIDYFENGWKNLINYLSNAKCVICPISHWTFLANLQQTPVFSWGLYPSQYKSNDENSLYSFGNKNFIMAANKDTKTYNIIQAIKYFMKEIL